MDQKRRICNKAAAGLLALLLTADAVPAGNSYENSMISVSASAEELQEAAEAVLAAVNSGLAVSSRNICLNISVSDIKPDKNTSVAIDGEDVKYAVKDGVISFTFECVPKKISDTHQLTVKSGKKVLLEKEISAEKLLKDICDNDADMKKAAENMLRYGSAAQDYFDYGTAAQAEKTAPASDIAMPAKGFDNASFNKKLSAAKAPVRYDGMSICFDEDLTLKMIFSPAADSDISKAEEFIRSNISFRDGNSEVSRNGNKICVIKHDIGIREIEKQFTLTALGEDTKISVSQFMANVMAEKSTDEETVELQELCKALYSLYDSVKEIPENYTEPVKEEQTITTTTSAIVSSTTTTTTTTASDSGSSNTATTTTSSGTADPIESSLIVPTKIKGMYSYTLDDAINSTPHISTCGNLVMLYQPDYIENSVLQVYDINTGELVSEKLLPPYDDFDYKNYSMIENGIIEESASSLVKYYDISLNEQKTFDLNDYSDKGDGNVLLAISDSGRYIFFTSYTYVEEFGDPPQSYYFIIDTENESCIEIMCDDNLYGANYNSEEECFYCNSGNGAIVKITPDGTVTENKALSNALMVKDKAITHSSNGMYISNPDGSDAKFVFYDKEDEAPYYTNGKYAVSFGKNLRLYDLDNDMVSDPFKPGGVSDIIFTDNDRILLSGMEGNNKPFLKMIKPEEFSISNKLRVEKDIDMTEPEKMLFKDPYGSDEELDPILTELYDRFGIKLFFELNRHMNNKWDNQVYDSYYGDRVLKAQQILDYFNNWPDDICRQVTDNGSDLWIIICEEFHPAMNDPELIDPAGQALSSNGRPTIILEAFDELDGTFVQNLSHEFIHTLNNRMDFHDTEAWESLSPADGYKNSFADYYSATQYTSGFEKDLSNVYFIDSYGRVNSEEDRARIGEYLWYSYVNGELDSAYGSEHIRAKAELLIKMYREKYSCLAEIEEGELYLEKALSLPLGEYIPYETDENGGYAFG